MAVFTDLSDALGQIEGLLEAPASGSVLQIADSARNFSLFGGSGSVSQDTWNQHYPDESTRPPMLARDATYVEQVNLVAFEAGFISSGYTNPLRPGTSTETLAGEYVAVLQDIDEFGFFLDNCAQTTKAQITGALDDYMRNTGIQQAGRDLNKTLGKADYALDCIAGFATLFDSKGVLDDALGLMDMPGLNNRVKSIVRDITDPTLLSSVLFNLDEVKDLLDVEQTVCDAIHDGMDSLVGKDLAALTGSLNKLAQWAAVAKLATSDPCSLVTNNMLLGHITEPVMDDLIDLYKAATTTQGDVIETAIDIFVPDGIPGSYLIGDIYEKGSLLPVGTYLGGLASGFQDNITGGLDAGVDIADAIFKGENSISTGLMELSNNIDGVDFQSQMDNIADISLDGISLPDDIFGNFVNPLGELGDDAMSLAGGAFDALGTSIDTVTGAVSAAEGYVSGVLSAGGGLVGAVATKALSGIFGGLLGGSGLPVTAPSIADIASPGAAGAGAGGGSSKARSVFAATGAATVLGGASSVGHGAGAITAFTESIGSGGSISASSIASIASAGTSVLTTGASAYVTTALNDMSGTSSALDIINRASLPAIVQKIDTATHNFSPVTDALRSAKSSSDWSDLTLGSCFGGSGSTASACASSGGLWRSMQGVVNSGLPKFNVPSLGKHPSKRATSIESVFSDNKLFDVSSLLS